ncbi:MAG: hypothetical protein AAF657_10710 [Acidobacteriota bacterium]
MLFALYGRVRGECTVAKPAKKWNGVPIGLIADAGVPAGVIEKAVDYWAACETYGKGFPPFVTTPLDERSTAPRLEVTLVRYSQSERCATFHGRTITLYAFARHRTGKPILCGSLAQNLAHELGHFLGLKHAAKAADCKLDIMSTVKQVNSRRRRVTEGECRAVDSRWLAADERPPEGPLGERALARLEEP